MSTVQTQPRTTRRTTQPRSRPLKPRYRADNPATKIPPPPIGYSLGPQHPPLTAANEPALAYELFLAIPIRRKCFALRQFMGVTDWSSFRLHCTPSAESEGMKLEGSADPFR